MRLDLAQQQSDQFAGGTRRSEPPSFLAIAQMHVKSRPTSRAAATI